MTNTLSAEAMEAAREALSKSDYATAHDIEGVVAIALDAFAEKQVAETRREAIEECVQEVLDRFGDGYMGTILAEALRALAERNP